MTTPKAPGMVKDPWRNRIADAPPPPPKRPDAIATASTREPEEDFQDTQFATIELKGYGGITVSGTLDVPVAAVRLLKFCVDHKDLIEDIFTDFGLVITQMPVKKMPEVKFYVQRNDGWLLAVPMAKTRDEGALQLIQAMLQVQAQPLLRRKLEERGIMPYKM